MTSTMPPTSSPSGPSASASASASASGPSPSAAFLAALKLPDRAARRRMLALGRAELTLLLRNRMALFSALLMPVLMIGFMVSMTESLLPKDSSLGMAALIGTGGIGMVLIMAVYSTLIPAYVSRREERVLKRLRTGEATDAQILAGTALPAVTLGLAQIVLLLAVGTRFPSLSMPTRPDLLIAGIVLGTVLMVLAAIVTAAFTRTAESAQITAMPVFLLAMFTSGMMMPLDVLPDGVASICQIMPMTPAIDLIRAGWLGETAGGGGAAQALAVGLLWMALAVYAVRRYFRWDPRQ